MTNVSRPIHLHLRSPGAHGPSCSHQRAHNLSNNNLDDSYLPSQIMPYLFVGNQEQTNREILTRLNISYILSLQSLPRFLTSQSNTVTSTNDDYDAFLPSINSSKDYSVRFEPNDNNNSSNSKRKRSKTNKTTAKDEATKENEENDHVVGENDKQRVSFGDDSSQDDTGPTNENENTKLEQIKGKFINISDTFEQLLGKFFEEANNFIEEARRNKCNILVHCNAGISRSPTIAIAYLMKLKRLHLNDAYNFVKKCRPQISPNLNFMGQLVSYEHRLMRSLPWARALELHRSLDSQEDRAHTTRLDVQ